MYGQDNPWPRRRGSDRMMRDIEAEVGYTSRMIRRQRLDPRVMAAMRKVPRQEFVGDNLKDFAFENGPLPIGHGQTISQPYMVALMTDLARPRAGDVVLEVGTGSGYQAAILAELASHVYTMEIIPALAGAAAGRFQRLGYENITTRVGDGYHGWDEHSPYDAIVVTAAAEEIPPPLVDQLRAGGRLVIPLGTPYSVQHLYLLEKLPDGQTRSWDVLPVAFVPLTGAH